MAKNVASSEFSVLGYDIADARALANSPIGPVDLSPERKSAVDDKFTNTSRGTAMTSGFRNT